MSNASYGHMTEQEYRDLYHRAPCGYLTTTKDGLIISINQTLADWLSVRPDDIIGRRHFRQLLTPASQVFAQTHCAPLLQMQGWISEVALELLRTDQSSLPVLMSAVQEPSGPDHQPVNRITLFNATDRRRYEREILTAKKHAEDLSAALKKVLADLQIAHEKLAEKNAELTAIYSGLPICFFRIDRDGTVMHCNHMFTDMTNCSAGATLAEWLSGLQSPSTTDLLPSISLSLDQKQSHLVRFRRDLGIKPAWHEIRLWPVDPSSSIRDGFLGLLRDVTAEVLAEEQGKLAAAQEAASDVASGVAHNFNSLWSVIMASAEQIGRQSKNLPIDQWSRLGKLATERGAEITKKLMAYSGQLHLELAEFDLLEFLEEITPNIKSQLLDRQTLRFRIQRGDYRVRTDRAELKAVLGELVRNAAQASGSDTDIEIGINSVRREGKGTVFHEISICDHGSGMDNDVLRSAETPFFTTKEIGGGIGLGLSYARGFAKQSDGYLDIRSSPGAGTTVRLALPSASSIPV